MVNRRRGSGGNSFKKVVPVERRWVYVCWGISDHVCWGEISTVNTEGPGR